MPSTTPVAPDAARPPVNTQGIDSLLYELRPAYDLPVVDLSVSLRARFLTKNGLARVTKCMRHGRLLFSLFVVGGVLLVAMFVSQDVIVIQPLAIMSSVCMLPAPLIGIAVLRFEVVRLLVKTYDFWFFNATNIVFLVVVSALVRDARIVAAVVFAVGCTNNLLGDANLRGARRTVQGNVGVFTTSVLFSLMLKLDWIMALRDFDLFRYGAHALPAKALAESCQLTLTAMTARNVYRGRQALWQGGIQEVHCVSLRCSLRLRPVVQDNPEARGGGPGMVALTPSPSNPIKQIDCQAAHTEMSPLQRLRCVLSIGVIDPHNTLVRRLGASFVTSRPSQVFVWFVGFSAFAMSIAAAFDADYGLKCERPSSHATLQIVSATLTAAFVGCCVAMYLRGVFQALVSSFDFLYVSTLLTVVHETACDFFQWHTSPCCVVLTSWLWIHWMLCVDALSPLVKDAFRLHVRFPAVVITTAMAGAILLLHRVIVLDTSEEVYDRVLWSSTVLGNAVELRVVPVFYNSMANVLVFGMRLLYHAWWFDADMLIMLDGPVAYTNYLSKATRPLQVAAAPPAVPHA